MIDNVTNTTSDNYFKLLGLPVSFDINNDDLNNNYHEIQKSVHPDKFASSSDLERRLSVQKAAQINDALETLKNPLRRSIYLLSLYGVELSENGNAMDPAFLMEQMELRENLSQVDDREDPLAELDEILDDVKLRIKKAIDGLSGLFKELGLQDSQEQLLKETRAQVLKMQFLSRLQEECLNKEEDLADQL